MTAWKISNNKELGQIGEFMQTLMLSSEQMRKCDKIAIEHFQIPSIVLMENAGAGATKTAYTMLGDGDNSRVVIAAGVGNNGGDGFVVARGLYNLGVKVEIFVIGRLDRITPDALTNLNICRLMSIPIRIFEQSVPERFMTALQDSCVKANLIIDALLGTGSNGPAREPIASVINVLNQAGPDILALDIPSGLNCDNGMPFSETIIRASQTVTFACEKTGFANPQARQFTGKMTVASIGIKTELLCEYLES